MFRPPGFGRLVWQTATIFLASLLAVGPASAYKPPPRPPALNILLERANNGNVTAQNLLGMQYLRGENGANRDHTEARKWLSLAAQNEGNDAVQAKWVLGTMLYYGIGGPMEKQKGLELQQKVVAQNRLHLALGEQYYQVGKFSDAATILTHGIKPDDWLPNVAVAHRLLGLMHLRGDGVVRSDVQAFSHFCRAAFGEDGISMIFLAGLYAEGKGVERNPDFSKLLVREAAKRGVDFSKTAFKNSFPSLEGDGEVVRQLAKLAESGDAGASYSLGLAFRSGRGVAASSELAITQQTLT